MTPIRALSLWQPWASAMVTFEPGVPDWPIKTIETRHWPIKVSEPFALAIHAAKQPYKPEDHDPEFAHAVDSLQLTHGQFPYGAVLGIVWIVACKKVDEVRDSISPLERAFGNYVNLDKDGRFQQRYAFGTDPSRLLILKTPYPMKGAQGIFSFAQPEGLEFR